MQTYRVRRHDEILATGEAVSPQVVLRYARGVAHRSGDTSRELAVEVKTDDTWTVVAVVDASGREVVSA